MLRISYAWTTPALTARRKTCTRREWDDDYAKKFEVGQLCQAFDRNPRNGGKRVGIVRLTQDPYKERLCDIPMSDWEAEGFDYLTEIGATVNGLAPIEVWNRWKLREDEVWVVRFEVVSLD